MGNTSCLSLLCSPICCLVYLILSVSLIVPWNPLDYSSSPLTPILHMCNKLSWRVSTLQCSLLQVYQLWALNSVVIFFITGSTEHSPPPPYEESLHALPVQEKSKWLNSWLKGLHEILKLPYISTGYVIHVEDLVSKHWYSYWK